jgi:glutamine amidotransferase PdxT
MTLDKIFSFLAPKEGKFYPLFKDASANLIIAAEQGNVLALAFHPELTDDLRIHQYFLDKIFSC